MLRTRLRDCTAPTVMLQRGKSRGKHPKELDHCRDAKMCKTMLSKSKKLEIVSMSTRRRPGYINQSIHTISCLKSKDGHRGLQQRKARQV